MMKNITYIMTRLQNKMWNMCKILLNYNYTENDSFLTMPNRRFLTLLRVTTQFPVYLFYFIISKENCKHNYICQLCIVGKITI
jgi:hypothetical protein